MLALDGCPYEVLEDVETRLLSQVKAVDSRVPLLRGDGRLTDETLGRYYENTRLVDVTESNGIEGSTLELRETELAVMKGATLTGHDPAHVRDARTLFEAFERLAELACSRARRTSSRCRRSTGSSSGSVPAPACSATSP